MKPSILEGFFHPLNKDISQNLYKYEPNKMKAVTIKTHLLVIISFTALLLSMGCSQSSTEANNTNSTTGSNTTGDPITDNINKISYKAGSGNNEELIEYEASYISKGDKCILQVMNTYQYVTNSAPKSQHTKTFRLKDLDPLSLKVEYQDNAKYGLFVATKNFKKAIKHKHTTINKKVFTEYEAGMTIFSKNETLLKNLKAAFLKRIQDCHCVKGDFMKEAKTSFTNITNKINGLSYTSRGSESKKINGNYKLSNMKPGNKCLIEVISNKWYTNASDSSKSTNVFNLKDLDPPKLKVKYTDIMETYSLSLHTKNGQGLIKQKLPTKDGGSTSINTSLFLIYSDDETVLKTLKEDFLKAIKGCECGE
ncbi:hypothetical protein BKI52_30250 [marine bacterium AO1-C]|nr:hypothetical protein BKI52_30250 [marine bacterium AO1-C]